MQVIRRLFLSKPSRLVEVPWLDDASGFVGDAAETDTVSPEGEGHCLCTEQILAYLLHDPDVRARPLVPGHRGDDNQFLRLGALRNDKNEFFQVTHLMGLREVWVN